MNSCSFFTCLFQSPKPKNIYCSTVHSRETAGIQNIRPFPYHSSTKAFLTKQSPSVSAQFIFRKHDGSEFNRRFPPIRLPKPFRNTIQTRIPPTSSSQSSPDESSMIISARTDLRTISKNRPNENSTLTCGERAGNRAARHLL